MVKRKKRLHYKWSDKHKAYMRKTDCCSINIAEGSIRSGKTTDNVFCFARALKQSKDKIHLATASTQPTAKLIIGDCDGYGLEHIFRGQCKWGKYKGNECLRIKGPDTGYKEKIVLFCGGGKADSYKRFRGMTIGLWIATEINLHHENTIREAMKRQLNAHIKRLYWDLNPENPKDFIYTEFIDEWAESNSAGKLVGGYNYEAFNIFDNINLSKANLEDALSKYVKGSVFYKRDILGERCVAEGLIYQVLADDPERFMIEREEMPVLHDVAVGEDFGGNKSGHAIVCSGVCDGVLYFVRAKYKLAKGSTASELVSWSLSEFDNCFRDTGRNFDVYADSAEQVLINSIQEKSRFHVYNSLKLPIIDRIRALNILLTSGRVRFVRGETEDLIEALSSATWDEKSQEDKRLDNGTFNNDIIDAAEYSFEYNLDRLVNF